MTHEHEPYTLENAPVMALKLPLGALSGWGALVHAFEMARDASGLEVTFGDLIEQVKRHAAEQEDVKRISPVHPLSATWKSGERVELVSRSGCREVTRRGTVHHIGRTYGYVESLWVRFDDGELRTINQDVMRHVRDEKGGFVMAESPESPEPPEPPAEESTSQEEHRMPEPDIWKPGDVALVREDGEPERVGIRDTHGWAVVNDRGDASHSRWVRADYVTAVRPLAVIDPEDREAVERLLDIFRGLSGWASSVRQSANALQAALREFASPTPPKPEEPTGLGAVVRDSDGRVWQRTRQYRGYNGPWLSPDGRSTQFEWRKWDEVDAVEVLSEGWEEQP